MRRRGLDGPGGQRDGDTTAEVTGRTGNGGVSYWYRQIGLPIPRAPLPGSIDADVAIVGAGLTGLWSAYYLRQADPSLRVVLVEKEFAGFGASGRNGGWLSAELAGSRERYARDHGRDGVADLLRSMRQAVDEVIGVAQREGIDADVVKGGVVEVARNPAQVRRLRERLVYDRQWGATEQDVVVLSRDELDGRITIDGALAGMYSPHCARVQPAKLVQGIAAAVERSGATIYERTTASSISPGQVHTDRGVVRAPVILRCLEGYTASLRGERRNWLPLNSSMIVTEPLDDDLMADIGWDGAETLGDMAHAYMYAQRTADNRIALGGRGVPYRYASRTDVDGVTQQRTIEQLVQILHSMFPGVRHVPVAHAWCGVLGVPRDWCTTVAFDRGTGIGTAGGYVGSGLTTTNLAGRTLADLVLGRDTELTRLPWVGRSVRQWEPEPLRYLGVHAMYALYHLADRNESGSSSSRSSVLAGLADTITRR